MRGKRGEQVKRGRETEWKRGKGEGIEQRIEVITYSDEPKPKLPSGR
jgi:hypothetical protein